jgi:ribosomal protein S24E
MNVVKEFENDLLKRKEVVVTLESESNPGFERSVKEVAGHFKVDESEVVVRRVGSSFGNDEFVVEAFVYDSAEQKDKIEPKKKEKKK